MFRLQKKASQNHLRVTTINLTVNAHHIRLDKYLSDEIDFLSRTKLKEYILSQFVLVNGLPAKPSTLLEGGETIIVNIPKPKTTSIQGKDIPLDILYEDEYLAAINKPAGLVTHPGAGNYKDTLVHALLYHLDSLSSTSDMNRPGIVHRLDKNTSGIILVAKSDESHLNLSEQFANRTVSKVYLALVWGTFEVEEGTVEKPILRHPKNRQKFCVGEKGKKAITKWRVVDSFDYLTLLELRPQTGRTHQLRVHLSSINHPVFYDTQYGGGKRRVKGYLPEVQKWLFNLMGVINRQALHALSLSFHHPITKNKMTLTAPLASDFKKVLHHLGSLYA